MRCPASGCPAEQDGSVDEDDEVPVAPEEAVAHEGKVIGVWLGGLHGQRLQGILQIGWQPVVPFFHGSLEVECFFGREHGAGDQTLVDPVGQEMEAGLCNQAGIEGWSGRFRRERDGCRG